MSAVVETAAHSRLNAPKSVLLQRVQPAMAGLIDGPLSTLAPIFAVATVIGGSVRMAFSEGLSNTGMLTGRGSAYLRGAITGAGTFVGGILHTLPFLIRTHRRRRQRSTRRSRRLTRRRRSPRVQHAR